MASVIQESGSNQLMTSGTFCPPLGEGAAVSTGGGGGGGGLAPFDIEGSEVVRCGLFFGRTWVECDDTELSVLGGNGGNDEDGDDEDDGGGAASGVIFATVTHDGSGLRLAVNHASQLPPNGLDVSHRGLYVAKKGEWVDIRAAATIMAMD